MSWQKKTEQSTNICRWWNTGCQHDSLGLGSTAVQQSLIADLGFKSNLPKKWSSNFCCGRLSQKPSLDRKELKAREEGWGGRQEFICLNNKISTTAGMQFVGVITELGICPTRASLITTVSCKPGSRISVVFLQSRKIQAGGILHQTRADSYSNETWNYEFKRSPTLHTYTEATVWARGSSQPETSWEPLGYK